MVHTFSECGINFAVDCESGSIHVVDEVVLDVISVYETLPREEIISTISFKYSLPPSEVEECLADIDQLKSENKLFAPRITFNADDLHLGSESIVKALCLHVSHACNLTCEYCFAGQGKYHGKQALMSFEVGRAALDFLIASSCTRHNLEVDFFGGEPLLNWEVVKNLVQYARSREKETNKHFRFTLTTNGLLVDDEVINFSNQEIDNVVLSLDGRQEINDYFRKTQSGIGSYDIIVPKFQKFVAARNAAGKEYYIRGTFTHLNPDFMKDVDLFLELGFDRISMEPVVCNPSSPYALTEEDKPIIQRQYEILAERMIEREKAGAPFVFYHYMLDLEHGPCIYKRLAGCGSGTDYLAVTPTGDLYPCHQFVGEPNFLMGNVYTGVKNFDMRDRFKKSSVLTKPDCTDCTAKLWCAGGCAANSFHATNSINDTHKHSCDLFKKRLQCAIAVNASRLFGKTL